ncbi:hypothetical protein V8C42DRAFT_316919 [Trichoderma barbatum]
MATPLYQDPSSPVHNPQPPDASRPKPVSAAALAAIEKRRRDLVRSLGPCPSGCKDLDNYVLLGGLERGSVVGLSAEEEDAVGVTLGLQVLVCSLLDNAVQKVQIVTPKPPSTIVILLKNGITAELKARGTTAPGEIAAKGRDCLERIMLSRVFDMDGLSEVLADLDSAAAPGVEEHLVRKPEAEDAQLVEETVTKIQTQTGSGAALELVEHEPQEPPVVAEIQDSQDEDEALSPSQPLATPPRPDAHDEAQQNKATTFGKETKTDTPEFSKATTATASNHNSSAATPDIILITHFSSLLTSFFTQRDKSAAHATLRLLASRLRHLSRTLPSNPLILLVNSTDSGAAPSTSSAYSSESHKHDIPPPEQPASHKPSVDPTLRSIFYPASSSSAYAGASPHGQGYKPNKPTFGLVFTQLLDLHLLCTRAPRPGKTTLPRALTVVEVLLDDIGVWEGERGLRRGREQRWTVVAPFHGRIIDASDGKRLLGRD